MQFDQFNKISIRIKIQITPWIPCMYTHLLDIQSMNSSIEFCLIFSAKLIPRDLEEKEFC
jgi:hypothetical protein